MKYERGVFLIKDINECRKRIDEIDDVLIKLFEERMEIAISVANYKREHNLPIFNKEREDQVIEKNLSKIKNEEIKEYGEKMIHCLMDLSKDYQKSLNNKDKR